jgi:glycosyltransferase involved in cell wall biosynthesis
VPDGDIDALADALGSVLGDANRVAALSAAARASAERHTPESSMQRMADLFAAVVERPRRRSGSPLYRA